MFEKEDFCNTIKNNILSSQWDYLKKVYADLKFHIKDIVISAAKYIPKRKQNKTNSQTEN